MTRSRWSFCLRKPAQIRLAALLSMGVMLLPVGQAQAATKTFTYSQVINGASPLISPAASEPPPWLTAVISDFDVVGTGVSIAFKANLAGASEFIDNVGFNLNGATPPPDLPAATISCIGSCQGFSYHYEPENPNSFSVVSGGSSTTGKVSGFDIGFIFARGSEKLLTGTDRLTVQVAGSGIDAARFNTFVNTPASPGAIQGLYSAAKVQGIALGGSGEIAGVDPPPVNSVPGPLPLLGIVAALRARRRLRQLQAGARR